MEGCGVGGGGEVRVYVKNMTVGGVGRRERTLWWPDRTIELKDGSARGR